VTTVIQPLSSISASADESISGISATLREEGHSIDFDILAPAFL
jgi:hypothetical protein